MGTLGPLRNRRSDLFIRNGVLLYKQLIRPMMDYAYSAWGFAARTHVRKLHVLQSKCLRLVTGAPWYVSGRQIHEELGVPLFADHIRALNASFDSKLADVRNPLVQQLGRYLRWPRADALLLTRNQRAAEVGKAVEVTHGWPYRLHKLCSALISRTPFGSPV